MLSELLSIFKKDDPLASMGANFTSMLEITGQMTLSAGRIYFVEEEEVSSARAQLYQLDIEVNRLERLIRKQVVAHLAIRSNTPRLPYCLALMNLVKDTERVGDYAKNLAEVMDIQPEPWPEDELTGELRAIRAEIEAAFSEFPTIFSESRRERALELIHSGRASAHRSDDLIAKVAHAHHPSPIIAGLVLGARYYKRIGGHVLNLLSSVVMPLHKIDYFDEDDVPDWRV